MMKTEERPAESGAGKIRLIAFYLPQFHPIPENDLWWGAGFTEWTNATKARPLFAGHHQPHLPADLGFYDLRLRRVRHQQIALAKQYGVDGFCYHFYWFSGKRLLHEPLDDMLADPESDMPFCLCWPNENWTRRWDGAEHEILISQDHRPGDDLNFIKDVAPFLRDERYIRINGTPIFIVYRPQALPDSRRSTDVWREYCMKEGIGEIHLCAALTHGNWEYARLGFDSGVEFPPHNLGEGPFVTDLLSYYDRFQGLAVKFDDVAQAYLNREHEDANVFRTVFPSWDNTARKGLSSVVVLNGTPRNYEYWLSEALRRTAEDFPGQDRLVFVNAWNEWAEGCHLEPDQTYGRQFLEATLRARSNGSHRGRFEDTGLPVPQRRTLRGDAQEIWRHHSHVLLLRVRAFFKRHPRLKRFVKRILRRGAGGVAESKR